MSQQPSEQEEIQAIKCLVWDLDNTLWEGILLEDEQVTPIPEAVETLKTLDQRGILHSIASKNDADLAMNKLKELGLDHYFLYPQISWEPKSEAVANVAKSINIGIDTLAFIDDQPFEREEVAFAHKEVLCIDAIDVKGVVDLPRMHPRFITDDSKKRRAMYQSDIARNQVEETFKGPQEAFLKTLEMVFTLGPAQEEDLKRAEELTVRTHQLNTTGYTYSYDELNHFRNSEKYHLLVADLNDKYGPYGKIGLALIERGQEVWSLKLLLMSCRVMSRGVGTIMINHIRNMAREAGVRLVAELLPNDRNRMMYMTYKFTHFREIEKEDNLLIFENDLDKKQKFPDYLKVIIE
ncbi:HAD-IIIC family phosphatase [Magnetococcales bacterium HHB-1]